MQGTLWGENTLSSHVSFHCQVGKVVHLTNSSCLFSTLIDMDYKGSGKPPPMSTAVIFSTAAHHLFVPFLYFLSFFSGAVYASLFSFFFPFFRLSFSVDPALALLSLLLGLPEALLTDDLIDS
jgi:hypothetical protein